MSKFGIWFFRAVSLSMLVPSGCATRPAVNPRPAMSPWTEYSERCKKQLTYAYKFDDRDYEIIAAVAAEYRVPARVYWKGDDEPLGGCPTEYIKDLRFESLKESLPTLKRETYESFLERNHSPVAAHSRRLWTSSSGSHVKIVDRRNQATLLAVSRAGFSRDGRQALIHYYAGMRLYEFRDGTWQNVGFYVIWML